MKFDILTGVPAMSVRHSVEVAKVGSGSIAFTVGYVRGYVLWLLLPTTSISFKKPSFTVVHFNQRCFNLQPLEKTEFWDRCPMMKSSDVFSFIPGVNLYCTGSGPAVAISCVRRAPWPLAARRQFFSVYTKLAWQATRRCLITIESE